MSVETVSDFLEVRFPEISPKDYYGSIFPLGSLEKQGEYHEGEYCGIATQIRQTDGRTRRVHVTDGFPQLEELLNSRDFVIMPPVSFAGRHAANENARFLFALQFDLDFLRVRNDKLDGMNNLLYQMSLNGEDPYNRLPKPTYIIATSARNCHVVYLLDCPIAMYQNVQTQIREFRKAFIPKLWDSWITTAYDQVQFETSPAHAFRMVGSWDKLRENRVRAFKVGDPVSVDYLNEYVPESAQITAIRYKTKYTITQARELFPEWYSRKILKQPNRTFVAPRWIYDSFKKRKIEIQVGHRYFYMVCLCAFGIKCGIQEDELMRDLAEIRSELDVISPEDNPLTMDDLVKAAQAFNAKSRFMRRETIARLCGIEIKPSKRNGRKQSVHLTIARATKRGMKDAGVLEKEGRPTKEAIIKTYAADHPDENNSQIARALGVSRTTVVKWLNSSNDNQEQGSSK